MATRTSILAMTLVVLPLAVAAPAATAGEDKVAAPPPGAPASPAAPAPTAPTAATTAPVQEHVQVRRGTTPGHPEWRWHELTPDLSKVNLVIGIKPGGATLEAMAPAGALAMINGGYFDQALKPTTWVKDSTREYHGKNAQAKNSGVLVAPADQSRGAWVGAVAKAPAAPAFVVQNSPMLIDGRGRIVAPPSNTHRAARTVACSSELQPKGGPRPLKLIVILASPGVGPTLYETAELLKKPVDQGGFGCRVALNLDGGPSSGVWYGPALTAAGAETALPLLPVGYGIALVPK